MAKLSFLGEVLSAALFVSVILWQETSSFTIQPNEETTTTNDRGTSCDGITCPSGKSCEVNWEGKPVCVCNRICTKEYAPVCGSDGKTYSNRCLLNVAACEADTVITVAYVGECETEPASSTIGPISSTEETTTTNDQGSNCHYLTCPPDKSCRRNEEGQADCVCRMFCPRIYLPVCGSDGKTYSNACMLRVAACTADSNITIVHRGICNESTSCDVITCPSGKFCKVNWEGKPECVCNRMCTLEYAPVCGSDGKTYGNRCSLQVAACQADKIITVAYVGKCETESSCKITCPPGTTCVLDGRNRPKCV